MIVEGKLDLEQLKSRRNPEEIIAELDASKRDRRLDSRVNDAQRNAETGCTARR